MQIAQDFLSRAPAENPAHSGLCKGFSTGTIGRKDKQDAQVIFEQFLSIYYTCRNYGVNRLSEGRSFWQP